MLDRIEHGAVLELRLARPPVNAMNPELVRALRDAVQRAPDAGARALVLSGREGLFSAGLDIASLLPLDRGDIRTFFEDFFDLLRVVAASPIPTVAAITGHSPAGGAVLSTFCDYRVMAQGDYRFSYNEVAVGLVVPEMVRLALIRIVGAERAERLCTEATMLSAAQVHDLGIAHELAPAGEVVARALAWCGRILALPPRAMSTMRRTARADLLDCFRLSAEYRDTMTEFWFGDETQQTLRALMEKLKAGKARAS